MFIELTKFLGLFFASSGFTAGGDGGSDGNIDVGDSASGGADVAVEESEEAPVSEEGAEETEQPDQPEEDAQKKPKDDGRTVADAVKKALNAMRATDPKAAGELRKMYFEGQQYRQSFATPAEAQAAKDLIEIEGGAEGITKNKQEADAYAGELARYASGDTGAIDDLAKNYPESLAKFAPYGLEKLRQINQPAYLRTMAAEISHVFNERGVRATFNQLVKVISAGGEGAQQRALETAKTIGDWLDGCDKIAAEQREAPKYDKEREEIDKGKKEIADEKHNIYMGQVSKASLTRMNQVISKAMTEQMGKVKLDDGQKKGFYKDIFDSISSTLEGNATYQSQLKSLIKKGNIQEIARFVESHTKQQVGKAAAAAWKARGFDGGVRRTAPGGGNGAPAGTIRLSKKPDASQVDWSKDRDRSQFMTGRATLLNGKKVTWEWDAVS
jgi:hypothetical protein